MIVLGRSPLLGCPFPLFCWVSTRRLSRRFPPPPFSKGAAVGPPPFFEVPSLAHLSESVVRPGFRLSLPGPMACPLGSILTLFFPAIPQAVRRTLFPSFLLVRRSFFPRGGNARLFFPLRDLSFLFHGPSSWSFFFPIRPFFFLSNKAFSPVFLLSDG